jgi:hypothetical protein
MESNPPISLNQADFSFKQFAKMMGQANYSMFTKWKKVYMAGFWEKKHWFSIWGQNCLKQVWDGPLHWETADADSLQPFADWLPLDIFDNRESIWQL